MKKSTRKLLGIAAVLLTAAFLFVFGTTKTKAVESPELNILAMNLSYGDSVYLVYAVNCTDETADVSLLVWDEGTGSYEKGTETYILNSSGTATVSGKKCKTFYCPVPAKKMGDNMYARAYTRVNDIDYLSPVKTYSVLNYAYSKLGYTGTATTNESLKDLLRTMLEYGSVAQTYFNYKTDELVTGYYQSFYKVTVTGGTLPDGLTSGLYKVGSTITITAPEKNENEEFFDHWERVGGDSVYTA